MPKMFYRTDIISEENLRRNYSIYQLHSFFLQLGQYGTESMPNICHKE